MHRTRLVMSLAMAVSALSAPAALQFTNAQVSAQVANFSSALEAAATDGNSFLAVGGGGATLLGTFDGSKIKWSSSARLSSTSLKSVANGGGFFLAGAIDSNAYKTSDGSTWSAAGAPFAPSTPYVMGMAYNPAITKFAAA